LVDTIVLRLFSNFSKETIAAIQNQESIQKLKGDNRPTEDSQQDFKNLLKADIQLTSSFKVNDPVDSDSMKPIMAD
jgi:bifunctional ADP-heptose synthase (sugar kinase/adenylyltransferase)